ncbi:hypothetical protein [Rhodothermus bifroesti]|uniref:Lipoprotein n=1 Tax=Rhodothermus marinus TaxID=29549 RepID=A0A7V2B070_RHOMR|nr:hypothetical protein [Rhodothermus bifroesti]GBD02089.1 hypothetical protein HRbin18_01824 [bacterium HR18]
MRWILGCGLVLLLSGCRGMGALQEPEAGMKVWQSDTPWGQVTVRQVRSTQGLCTFREVTLHRQVGLYVDGRPTFVRATDYLCDDTFDDWRFRSVVEEQRASRWDLSGLLLHLMYSTLPIEEHTRW